MIWKNNKTIMKNFIKIIRKSISSPGGKESSTRIAGYFMLIVILIFSITFLGIEIYTAIQTNHISNEAIIIFGMILAHHLTLLGINKYSESKDNKSNNETKKIEL